MLFCTVMKAYWDNKFIKMNIVLIINEKTSKHQTLKVAREANTFEWAMKTSEWVHKKLAKLEQWRGEGEVVCLQQAGRPL